MKRTLLIAVFFSLALCNYAAEPNEPPISPLNDLPKKVKAGEPQSQSVNDEKTSSNKSVQKITPRHDLVDPIIIVYSAYYMDGGTQAFFLTDGAGKKRAISVDGRIEPGTQGRIYLGGHPTQGRLTTKDEERAYIDILKRAVEVYTPAQLAAMEEAIDKHALDDPHPVKEIAYVTAKEFLIQRLGPSYENYLKNHPSHKEAAKARESDEQSALKQAIKEQSDRAIIRFVQKYPDSKFVPDAIKHLQKFQYYPIKERRVLPYTVLPGFRDRRKGPGGLTINDVRMDFELKHGPWPKTTHFLKAENLGSITARQSDLNVATGGRIFFEQWALLGKMICKGTIEFSGEGLVLLPGTDVYLENGVIQGLRPDGGWLFESTAVQAEDYRWSENDNEAVAIIGYDGTCTITRYTGPGGDVSIPETLGVLTVTAIGDGAFEGCSSLTSVAIPDSVTTIGDEAFLRCSKLTGVTLGSSITTIGYDAFKNCSNLTSVIIPNSVTAIGSDAFRGCSSMASVTIPNSVTTVESGAFMDCSKLTDVTIPDSVTTIEGFAFMDCSSLTDVTIGNSVSTIGNHAFKGCSNLTSVAIPDSVTAIGDRAFESCFKLTDVTIGNSVTTIGEYAFFLCNGLTDVTIPDSVTTIGDYAFGNCSFTVAPSNSAYSSMDGAIFDKAQTLLIKCPKGKAGDYVIPNSVTAIGSGAFKGCSKLTSVTVPNSVTAIENGAFMRCFNLTEIYFKGDAPTLGNSVFGRVRNGTIYYIPGTAGWKETFGGLPTAEWKP